MFGGDSYLEGVLTLAYSIMKTNTKHDIVCMVTDDVSNDAKTKMKNMGIRIIEVPYLDFKRDQKRLLKRYPLISRYYTKWNILNLTEYDKVLFLDADLIVIKSIDHVFTDFKSPGSRFVTANPEISKIIKKHDNSKGLHFSPSLIKRLLRSAVSWTIDGGLVLLQPNEKHYKKYIKMMKTHTHVGIGGTDEYSLIKYMSLYDNGPKKTWTNLGDIYSCVQWSKYHKCNKDNSYILNFYGKPKPWYKENTYEDSSVWRTINTEMHNEYAHIF